MSDGKFSYYPEVSAGSACPQGHSGLLAEVTAVAPAKINVYFQVGRKRADGYHDVLSLYCAVSLYDTVKVARRRDRDVAVKAVRGGEGLDGAVAGIPLDGDNLAVRAVRALAESSVGACGVDIEICKNIPVAGGMAGGSADAAATLIACNKLWGDRYGLRDLERIGARLGADVPFCLRGYAAVGRGTGTELGPAVVAEKPLWWVVVPAGFGLSTAEVFAYFSHLRALAPDNGGERERLALPSGLVAALRRAEPETVARFLRNDLQRAAVLLSANRSAGVGRGLNGTDLEGNLAQGMEAGSLAALVSGSGPSIVLLASDTDESGTGGKGEDNARRIARRINSLRKGAALRCTVVQGPVAGAQVVSTVPATARR